ncbi:MAG: helix-turn-helix domain-containing protein [Pelagimonas sp.]|uniref:helix-turn-helix domain-containing protein n=1 Tax=Pelagimonas sp. TaxID=2073170 RepID=UPI003D6AF50F
MLKSFEIARNQQGRTMKAMAAECGVTDSTFYKWSCGIIPAPKHKRIVIARALGAPVDWDEYDRECMARPKQSAQSRQNAPQSAPSSDWGVEEVKRPEVTKQPVQPPRDEISEHWGL